MKIPDIIEYAIIIFPGDPTVGIFAEERKIEVYVDFTCYADDKVKLFDQLKKDIKEFYTKWGDSCPSIQFDFEIKAENELADRIENEQN